MCVHCNKILKSIPDSADVVKIDEGVFQCLDCGAHAKTAEQVVHHPTCEPGDARRWENFYEKANEEETGEW